MPLNLIKTYSDLLDLVQFNEPQRITSLKGVFKRDIENNLNLNFRSKQIRPIKRIEGENALETLFHHLTTKDEYDENGKKVYPRKFEMARSIRLHWIKYHIEESKKNKIDIFSYEDRVSGKSIIRTYIYDLEQEYIVILEPQRSGRDYYLLTAYHLNEPGGKKQIQKKQQKKLAEVY